MFRMTNSTGIYDVNWFTDDQHTFIEKCLVDYESLDQIGDDNNTRSKENKHTVTPRIRDHIPGHQHIGTIVLNTSTEMGVYLLFDYKDVPINENIFIHHW